MFYSLGRAICTVLYCTVTVFANLPANLFGYGSTRDPDPLLHSLHIHTDRLLYCPVLYCTVLYCPVRKDIFVQGQLIRGAGPIS